MKYKVKLVPITSEKDMAEGKQACYLPNKDGTFTPHKIELIVCGEE